MRRFAYGGSPISPRLLERVLYELPDVELVSAYGQTETGPVITMLGPDEHRSHTDRRFSAGRSALHSQYRVVGPDLEPLLVDEAGEIEVRGPHVMLGYWKRPDLTKEVMHDGWIRTGDAGRIDDDGYLFIVDRVKDMIVSGGENVYAVEVERVLSQHAAVVACAVIVVPDEYYGERVHAVIQLEPGVSVTLEELRAFAKQSIAGYKAPRSVEVVESFPISGAGKILKHELRNRHWADHDRRVS